MPTNKPRASVIREAQQMLNILSKSPEHSYLAPLHICGDLNEETLLSLEAFRKHTGAEGEGLDLATYEGLKKECGGAKTDKAPAGIFPEELCRGYAVKRGAKGDSVILLKIALRALSKNADIPFPSLTEDYDEETEEGVRALQRILKLPESGITDLSTWNGIASLVPTVFLRE